MIIYRRRNKKALPPTMSDHADNLIESGASSIYALRMLRSQLVARMTTIASLLYASPAWWGFTSAAERSNLERLVARIRRDGYLPADHPSFENLAMIADQRLYRSIV